VAEESWESVASGKAQAGVFGARNETWFWPPFCAGTAGAGCEFGAGFAEQHGILPPQWQQARTGGWAHRESVCAGRNGVPTSKTLHTMANTIFMP
jgi:hypothetical protein